ncbi:MAG: WYL domain-containing protein [Gemmatimonadaceae bacterium]
MSDSGAKRPRRAESDGSAGASRRGKVSNKAAKMSRPARVPDTAARQLRRILMVIPGIADGNAHRLSKVARSAGVEKAVLLADLKSLADRHGAPGGFVDGMQIYIGPEMVEVTSNHFLRPMGLTIHELCALELGLAILRAERPPDETAVIESARGRLRKLISRLPVDHGDIETRFAELAPTEGLPHLEELRKALRDHHKARITYRRAGANAATTRVVRPYAIVPASGMWYAVAYCEASEGLRVFRMDRVEGLTSLPDRYEIPATFSVRETLRDGKALQIDTPAAGMKVRYSAKIARWIAEREGVEVDADGSLTIEHPLADADWGVRHVLQYGPDAEVLEPPVLREEILRRLTAV